MNACFWVPRDHSAIFLAESFGIPEDSSGPSPGYADSGRYGEDMMFDSIDRSRSLELRKIVRTENQEA